MSMVVVWREDAKVIRALGGMNSLSRFEVYQWLEKGTGRFKRYTPLGWQVPPEELSGLTPIDEAQALEIRNNRSKSGRRGHATHSREINRVSEELGLKPGSETAKALLTGDIDPEAAKRIAQICRERHEGTNYDALLKAGYSKEEARALKEPKK